MTIAITIPAYRAQRFISDCLESIDRLDLREGVEVVPMVAVDACPETAEAIGGGYYWSAENVGPYVLRNSLMQKIDADYYLSFCADDIILPQAIRELLSIASAGYDIIRPWGQNMDTDMKTPDGEPYHMGVLMVSREALKALGGYRQARIYSDTDLWNRAGDLGLKRIKIPKTLFLRRLHPGQITKSSIGLKTESHKQAKERSRKLRKQGDLCIKPKTVELEER